MDGRLRVGEAVHPADAERVIDAEGRVAIPGLVESHLHLDKCHLDIDAETLDEAIRLTSERKRLFTAGDIADRARRLIDSAIVNGTTMIRAHTDVDPAIGLLGVETLLGLREEYAGLIDIQVVAFPQEGIHRLPGTLELLVAALDAGAEVLGACPYSERDEEEARRHVTTVLGLAAERGVPVDMHADFSDDIGDGRYTLAGYIADEVRRISPAAMVSIGHATSLGSLPDAPRAAAIEALADAGVSVVTLPHTDLHLGGRGDAAPIRRGLAPVRELLAAGVLLACSSNNVRNAFTPYGNADLLETALFLAQTAQLASRAELEAALAAVTSSAARLVGIGEGYGLASGDRADFSILDADDPVAGMLDRAPRRWVVKGGRVVAETVVDHTVFRRSIRPAVV